MLGTPAYLAPERLAGQPATVSTDLFALGVVLYEAATGRKPLPGALDATVAGTGAAAGGAEAVPVIEPDLARVIRRAMAPRPEDRYPSADAMAADLRRGGPDLPPTVVAAPTVLADPGTRVLPAAYPVEEPADHRRALAIAAAILLVIIALVIILILAANTKSPSTPTTTIPPSTTAPSTTVPPTTTTVPPTTTTVPPTTTTVPPTTTTTVPPTTTTTVPPTTTTTLPPTTTTLPTSGT